MQEQASMLETAPDYRCGSAVRKQLTAMNRAPRFRPRLVCPNGRELCLRCGRLGGT